MQVKPKTQTMKRNLQTKKSKPVNLAPDDGKTLTAKVKEQTLRDVLELIKNKKHTCIVIMDELTDVHNVGAVIRSAVASNADAIIVSRHNQAPINETVIKTSAYTAHMIPVVAMNINEAIRTLKDKGFWIHGLFMDGSENLWNADLTGKIAIVVGSEGKGIHAATKKLCDYAICIPMKEGVESLNASVAAAVVMFERVRQISEKYA